MRFEVLRDRIYIIELLRGSWAIIIGLVGYVLFGI